MMKNIVLCLWVAVFFQGIAAEKILKYDPDTVRSFSGTIVKVEEQNWYGKKPNLLFVIAPDGNVPAVLVDGGLSKLYKKNPKPGNKIQITGSFVKTNEREIVLSRSVTIDGRTIQVRQKNGVPLWISKNNKKAAGKSRHSFVYRRKGRGRH